MIEFFLALLLKHYIVDMGLQRHLSGVIDKGEYFGTGYIHYLQHGIGTVIVALFFISWPLAVLMGALDYFLHWQIDYVKTCFTRWMNWPFGSIGWYWASTVDQILHMTTYYILLKIVYLPQ